MVSESAIDHGISQIQREGFIGFAEQGKQEPGGRDLRIRQSIASKCTALNTKPIAASFRGAVLFACINILRNVSLRVDSEMSWVICGVKCRGQSVEIRY